MAVVLTSFITIFVAFSWIASAMAGPPTRVVAKMCGHSQVQNETKYMKNYGRIIQIMQNDMEKYKFTVAEEGDGPNQIYVLAQCMDDLSGDDCVECFSKMSAKVVGCFPSAGGRVFLDGCFMRFDNYRFFQEVTSNTYDTEKCGEAAGESRLYKKSARLLINELVEKAPNMEGYAEERVTSMGISVYGMASCWKTLTRELCAKCLAEARETISKCFPLKEGRALNTGCVLRYSDRAFTETAGLASWDPFNLRFVVCILGGAVACFVAILVGIFVVKIISKKRRNHQFETEGIETGSLVTLRLRFKYSTLRKATKDFSETQKIGQGGYGEVFKGSLSDGRDIAIKRLFISGKDQVEAVCNEIDIICLAQHKNLVRLIGCCFANESFLVYEFLANGSLDQILFDPEKKKELDWVRRLGIIEGTAEGLKYLHKDCQVRVVHRDIKASNILLDGKYRPKISDFGLARFYSSDKIISNTLIAGTLGYMAPEYLAQGRLTEKVDVYSFGIVVLEIVSGVQNYKYHPEDTLITLVTATWKHFQAQTVAEMIDRSIEVEDVNEVLRVVQIGLLCTQESPSLRPTMTNVVQMLRHKNLELPAPSKPPFTDEFLTMSENSFRSSSVRSLQHCSSVGSCKYYDPDNDLR